MTRERAFATAVLVGWFGADVAPVPNFEIDQPTLRLDPAGRAEAARAIEAGRDHERRMAAQEAAKSDRAKVWISRHGEAA
jgi:hypothetical protein